MARVLVVGSGGREHALVWKLSQSPQVEAIYALPGNPGCAGEPKTSCVDIDVNDHQQVVSFAREKQIDLVVIGPEAPIVAGLGDVVEEAGFACCAPSAQAGQLESSKAYCKQLLLDANIKTAQAQVFEDYHQAKESLCQRVDYPVVLKASGLAAGKGVVIAEDQKQALEALDDMMNAGKYGDAGAQVVIEDCLQGEELSYIVLADGTNYVPLASSQDHKRLLEGDKGPNTGGMGAYSPALLCDEEMENIVCRDVIEPTLQAMAERGIHYKGFLYAGLMIDDNNIPWVLEYNCRLGDPETQPLLMRLESDLYPLLLSVAKGELKHKQQLAWKDTPALGVVLASEGYPDAPNTGKTIENLPQQAIINDEGQTKVFHAGTKMQDNKLVSSGGRVLCITSIAPTLKNALQASLNTADSIDMEGKTYRRDIGWHAFARSDTTTIHS